VVVVAVWLFAGSLCQHDEVNSHSLKMNGGEMSGGDISSSIVGRGASSLVLAVTKPSSTIHHPTRTRTATIQYS
jgi:hypothetical protein